MFGTFKSVVGEGSEESRQRRAVRRHLNKKKEDKRHVDESLNEMTFLPGSMGHMMTAIHHRHTEGVESPHYHIHNIGYHDKPEGERIHKYLLIHKIPSPNINTGDGIHHPAHVFHAFRNTQGHHEVTHDRQVN
jgi:hypothetical protein